MARTDVDIANGFYESFSRQYADLVCNNLRPVIPEAPAYSQSALRSTDGIVENVDTALKISRGAIEADGVPYFVQGNSFISLSSAGVVTNHGTIAGTARVSLANSQNIIWIVVPGGASYHFAIDTSTLTLNVDPNFFGPADTVAFKDNFFFFTTSVLLFNSNLDGITFSPLDFGTAEVDPDPIQAVVVSNGQLLVLGTRTIQPYQRIGGAGFPVTAISEGTVERGMASRFGFTKADNTFFFIGGGDSQEVAIWRFQGANPVKISTPAIDHFMQERGNAEIEGVFAWSYAIDGEENVGFTFANRSFVYQVQASKKKGRPIWHERTTEGTRWRVNTMIRAYNRIYVGDERTGKIGIIDPSVFTEYGDTVFREFSTQPFNFDGAPAFANSYEMVMATGVGNAASTNPVVNHEFSDNGVNFLPMLPREMGEQGDFDHRVDWSRMGRIPQRRVLKFSTHEPVETTFFTLEVELDV